MKLVFLLAVIIAVAAAMPGNNAESGSGREGGHRGGPPHPDCPEVKALLAGKCPDRSNRECFKCVFEGCHPADKEEIPTCEFITACVTSNIKTC